MMRKLLTVAVVSYALLATTLNAQEADGKVDTPAKNPDVAEKKEVPVKPVKVEVKKESVKKAEKKELTHVGDLLDTVIPYLVNKKGEKIDYKELKDKEYIVFYWSALWCGPCRRFTPKLIDFYKKHGGGKKFEVVFVSLDRSEDKFLHYMKKMPWVAIGWGQKPNTRIREFAGGSIPHLMLIDKEGNILGRGRGQAYAVFKKLVERVTGQPVLMKKAEPKPAPTPKATPAPIPVPAPAE